MHGSGIQADVVDLLIVYQGNQCIERCLVRSVSFNEQTLRGSAPEESCRS